MKTQSSFSFEGYKINRSLIEFSGEIDEEKLQIGFKSSGEINNAEGYFKLDLHVFVKDTNEALNIELEAIGMFRFDKEVNQKMLDNFFYVNSSAILFPYLRAHISTLSALSGIEAITLPTMNLTELGKELKEHTITIEP